MAAAGGHGAFAALFQPGGRYNDMIRSQFFPLAFLNGTVFVHAGYSPDIAYAAHELGEVALHSLRHKANEDHDLWGERGLVWYRGLVYDEDRCAQLDEILAAAGGHPDGLRRQVRARGPRHEPLDRRPQRRGAG